MVFLYQKLNRQSHRQKDLRLFCYRNHFPVTQKQGAFFRFSAPPIASPERRTRELPRGADGKFTDGASGGEEKSLEEIAREIFPHLRGNEKQREGLHNKKQKGNSKVLTTDSQSDIIKVPDIYIGRSLGAKAQNYDLLELSTRKRYKFTEGTYLQVVEVFAGGRSKTPYRKAYKFIHLGGKLEDWEHAKGIGWLDTEEGPRQAEVHWSQCKGFGKHDFCIKRWLDES